MNKTQSDTGKLWQCVGGELDELVDGPEKKPILPKSFIEGLRAALETGLSCKQIVAFLGVLTGLYEMVNVFEEGELAGRSNEILRVMRGMIRLKQGEGIGDE